jgi:transaldolase
VDRDVDEARFIVQELAAAGIDLDAVARQLEAEGIALFAESYENLLRTIDARRETLAA